MSGSLTRGAEKTIPAFPAHAQPTSLRIWQEAHGRAPHGEVQHDFKSNTVITYSCPNLFFQVLQDEVESLTAQVQVG